MIQRAVTSAIGDVAIQQLTRSTLSARNASRRGTVMKPVRRPLSTDLVMLVQ